MHKNLNVEEVKIQTDKFCYCVLKYKRLKQSRTNKKNTHSLCTYFGYNKKCLITVLMVMFIFLNSMTFSAMQN